MHVRLTWKMTKGNIFIAFEMVEEVTLYARTFPPKLVGVVPPFLEWLQGYVRDDMDHN